MPTLTPMAPDFDPFSGSSPKPPPPAPGTYAGTMQAQPNAPDASMVPLSNEAEQQKNLMTIYGLMADRPGVQSAQDRLMADPTFRAQMKQADQLGTDAGKLSLKRQAGARVYESFNDLLNKAQAWDQAAPDSVSGGSGLIASSPTYQLLNSVPIVNNFTGGHGAQAYNTSMHHDIEKLVALYREMPSTGSGTGSDAQDTNFKDAMGQWLSAPDSDTALAIRHSAKDLIRAKSGLDYNFDTTPRPLDYADIAAINRYAKNPITEDSPYVGVKASPSSFKLLRDHPTPEMMQQFDAKFGRDASARVLASAPAVAKALRPSPSTGLSGGIGPRYDDNGNLRQQP